MNQMDVDLTSSSLKRPADFPPASSADKRAKILPDEQLTKLNSNMDRRRMYEILVDAAEANESLWRDILSNVLTDLTQELASTDMRDSVIANLTREHANDIVKSFNKDRLEEWKVGLRNCVKSKDWTDLVLRRMYISDCQII
jgi:hypothetical protein